MRGFESKDNPTFLHVSNVPGLANGAHEIDGALAYMDASGLTCDIEGTRWFIPLTSVQAVRQLQPNQQVPEVVIEKGNPNPPKRRDEK